MPDKYSRSLDFLIVVVGHKRLKSLKETTLLKDSFRTDKSKMNELFGSRG